MGSLSSFKLILSLLKVIVRIRYVKIGIYGANDNCGYAEQGVPDAKNIRTGKSCRTGKLKRSRRNVKMYYQPQNLMYTAIKDSDTVFALACVHTVCSTHHSKSSCEC